MKRPLCLVVLLAACGGSDGPLAHLETAPVTVGPAAFRCWVAKTPEARAEGLMGLRTLAPGRGMLFVFPNEAVVSFWMRDTAVPLDLASIGSDGRIVEVFEMIPFDETLRPSSVPVRLALELRAGVLASEGLGVGDVVAFPPGTTDGSK